MVKRYTFLRVDERTKKLLMEDCVRMFYNWYPEYKDMNISQDFMLNRVCLSYLDQITKPFSKSNKN
jgi:hypothetical protein